MPSEELLEKVSHLPTTPGVYLWRDQYNRIIYVGKAINLRNRVRSYVRNDANRAPKVAAMMKRAVDVEIIQTKTEMEALILENTLIKEHEPKYNIRLRDDKTYPYVKNLSTRGLPTGIYDAPTRTGWSQVLWPFHRCNICTCSIEINTPVLSTQDM